MLEAVAESYLLLTLGMPVVGLWMIGMALIVYLGRWLQRKRKRNVHAAPPHGLLVIGLGLVIVPSVLFAFGYAIVTAFVHIQRLL